MGRGIYKKSSNQWCPIKNIWTKQNGIWCPVKKVYTKVNGQWCLCFSSYVYDFTHFEWESPDYSWYSAGIDAVGTNGLLLHQHTYSNLDTNEAWLNIEFFNNYGNFIEKAISLGSAWPQCVKKIDDRIWFNFTETGDISAGFYSIPWDKTLEIYPVSEPYIMIPDIPYNWKVTKRKTDGKIFVSYLSGDSWDPPPFDPYCIYWYDEVNDIPVKILEIGGNSYSCGFTFDSEGNLWAGEYYLGWYPSMHILPCTIKMWPKIEVDNVISGQRGYLTLDEAAVSIGLGELTIEDQSYNWGPSDMEADDKGNIYVSANTYQSFCNGGEHGALFKIYKDNEGYYHKECIFIQHSVSDYYWNWFRSITIDNGYLILDVDHNQMDPNSPDKVLIFQI